MVILLMVIVGNSIGDYYIGGINGYFIYGYW
jgi:hypothetical protein